MPAAYRATLRFGSPLLQPTTNAWVLSAPDGGVLLFSMDGAPLVLDQALEKGMTARWIGEAGAVDQMARVEVGQTRLSPPPDIVGRPWAVMLRP